MREIKFRAWHTPFKGKKFGAEYKYGNNVISFHDMSPEKYELEQYTGLTDKNGVEIYEGDIVEYKSEMVNFHNVAKVVYFAEEATFAFAVSESTYYTPSDLYEVIGNIHENPELLEVD